MSPFSCRRTRYSFHPHRLTAWLSIILGLIALLLPLAGLGRVRRRQATNKGATITGLVLGRVAIAFDIHLNSNAHPVVTGDWPGVASIGRTVAGNEPVTASASSIARTRARTIPSGRPVAAS